MSTVPMLAPDGTPGDVPQTRVHDAVKAGFKIAAELTAPSGKPGLVPLHRVHDAINAGFMLKGAPIASPITPKGTPDPIVQEDRGAMPGGKLQGLPGTDFSKTPTPGEMVGDVALAASPIAAGMTPGAAGPGVARALAPIAKRYGIKALEGAGLAGGWNLYRELKKVFEGEQ